MIIAQYDTLRGRIKEVNAQAGVITFINTNHTECVLDVSPQLLEIFEKHSAMECLYELHGNAEYEYVEPYSFKLLSFQVLDYNIVSI